MVVFALTLFIPVVNAVKLLNSANKLSKILKSLGALNNVKRTVEGLEKIKNLAEAVTFLRDLMSCTEFDVVKSRAITAGMPTGDAQTAVGKLCGAITVPATRELIATKLESYTDAEIKVFLEDVNGNPNDPTQALSKNVSLIDEDIVKAWKVLKNYPQRVDMQHLCFFTHQLVSDAFVRVKDEKSELLTNYPNLTIGEILALFF